MKGATCSAVNKPGYTRRAAKPTSFASHGGEGGGIYLGGRRHLRWLG